MLIEPTTLAKPTTVSLNPNSTIQLRGLLDGAEVILIEIPNGAGGWMTILEGNVEMKLTNTNNFIHFPGRAIVRINKPTTVNSVGVAVAIAK